VRCRGVIDNVLCRNRSYVVAVSGFFPTTLTKGPALNNDMASPGGTINSRSTAFNPTPATAADADAYAGPQHLTAASAPSPSAKHVPIEVQATAPG